MTTTTAGCGDGIVGVLVGADGWTLMVVVGVGCGLMVDGGGGGVFQGGFFNW